MKRHDDNYDYTGLFDDINPRHPRETWIDKIKVSVATLGFIVLFVSVLMVVGFIVSLVVDGTSTHATEIKTEVECRNKDFAWHSVRGCMTQEMFRDNYIDQ